MHSLVAYSQKPIKPIRINFNCYTKSIITFESIRYPISRESSIFISPQNQDTIYLGMPKYLEMIIIVTLSF
ncbi:hypothetical protein EV194_11572 [Natronoflexus pectinivorans]|uniref:Uncharacterized protein n=1 Tax=Natronoflexus pectinivorans TaxID=682526 RepID=A0A4R2GDW5_9BACT|nr:hypothetical protein EV194_11572 [Natronoflexus pectinivorans]